MPRRQDLASICILGSGPIVIGQAAEFDYSGTQAIRALRAEGFRVILINSNPATIMTDPELADATYIEPLTPEFVTRVLEKERPDALLPTMGGQTALNIAMALHKDGTLNRLGVELIGAKPEVIVRAEDREEFANTMRAIGVDQPAAGVARSLEEAWEIQARVGFPAILRPSFTMGGSGGNIAYNREEFADYVKWSLSQSPTGEVLIDESLLGWKEYELELMRDRNDNVVIICGIENIDPMGVHTGDSITVAPIQTLTDREYQAMRDDALRIIRAVGVETGGCNIQFGVCPTTGRRVVIEMNPRVSRSSALASKATGYPIAKIAALLSVGYTLDELLNDITQKTVAAFEPTLDYTVVKIPRFAFEKFPDASDTLTTQMKSVGEAMSIARTFPEAYLKALRSLEQRDSGLLPRVERPADDASLAQVEEFYAPLLRRPTPRRPWYIFDALRRGLSQDTVYQYTRVDPWFLDQMAQIIEVENLLRAAPAGEWPADEDLFLAKRYGFGDADIAHLINRSEGEVRERRQSLGVIPTFKQVDTCAAEFEALTSYYYSTYETGSCESTPDDRPGVMILGGGPNRIGQGIEFDYCAVHAVMALGEAGYRTIMVNCNPETVSTDYDISDRLYFEPLTLETVLAIIDIEKPEGVILQFGGQTPLKLAKALTELGVRVLGTSPEAIDRTEDRQLFNDIVEKLNLKQPEARTVMTWEQAREAATEIGFPLMVRPSYVLGGLAMEVVHDAQNFERVFRRAQAESPDNPVLLDKFLNRAIEVDVDCISDGTLAVVGGIMEHIEEAGVHSGDSACALPSHDLPEVVLRTIREQTISLARELDIVGLMNVQFAVQDRNVYVLEVNPRASRTIPFVSKAIGRPLAKLAARAMLGESLEALGFTEERVPAFFSVKESVFPFTKFPEVDSLLSPEMRSTGEGMGIDPSYEMAFYKAQVGAGNAPPTTGTVFISVKDDDKWASVPIARGLSELGFHLVATRGTADYLRQNGLDVRPINKVREGQPHIVDAMINGEVDMVINTTVSGQAVQDSRTIRRAALQLGMTYFTTLAAARGAVGALGALARTQPTVHSIQELHATATAS
ncbi:carbamoyl phosphate synthase large subunit [Lujinxingia litoralis]|uniref:Carbamoyl phosphate synthase large chain n=1 Tax=Lujinxingia litoralis TaxID=2211119 RepID=A0A328CBP2_9DELT|nr:carbamoyl-phosphate synthase large subunit [Lujinxingia litoralis]RAL23547.1 carbamoyl phosphate synthase large subunit [Lujinxingia litoralis]